MNSNNNQQVLEIDLNEVLVRAIKYIVQGGAVAVAAFVIPQKKVTGNEVVLIALTAATTFAILDTYAPTIALGARKGAGFGIGSGLVGGIPLMK